MTPQFSAKGGTIHRVRSAGSAKPDPRTHVPRFPEMDRRPRSRPDPRIGDRAHLESGRENSALMCGPRSTGCRARPAVTSGYMRARGTRTGSVTWNTINAARLVWPVDAMMLAEALLL